MIACKAKRRKRAQRNGGTPFRAHAIMILLIGVDSYTYVSASAYKISDVPARTRFREDRLGGA